MEEHEYGWSDGVVPERIWTRVWGCGAKKHMFLAVASGAIGCLDQGMAAGFRGRLRAW